jgi:hypothetical protein
MATSLELFSWWPCSVFALFSSVLLERDLAKLSKCGGVGDASRMSLAPCEIARLANLAMRVRFPCFFEGILHGNFSASEWKAIKNYTPDGTCACRLICLCEFLDNRGSMGRETQRTK